MRKFAIKFGMTPTANLQDIILPILASMYSVIRWKVVSCYDIYSIMERALTSEDYKALAELRYQIRRFLHFSEQASRGAGLEPRQHQLMLALKGLPIGARPRIRELAERLQIRHHSAVELVNRLSAAGHVRRHRAGEDRREVLLSLTPSGEKVLRDLSLYHRAELQVQGPALISALKRTIQINKDECVPSKASSRTRIE
jgi:DNA-binding MarR family transcriptional regulator